MLFDVLVVTDPIIWIGVVCILFPLYHSISCSEDHLASHPPSCTTLKTSQMSQCESILHGNAVKLVDHTQRGGRISTRRWFRRYWLRFRPVWWTVDGTERTGGGWCSRTRPAWCHKVSRNTDCTGCTAHTHGGLSPTIFLSSTSALTSPHSSCGLDDTGVEGFLQPSSCHVIHLPCDLNHFEAYENTEEYAKLHLGLMHSRSSMSSL